LMGRKSSVMGCIWVKSWVKGKKVHPNFCL